MDTNSVKGFDGPYEAPLKLPSRKVLKSWIDYNGHMNVAYYTMAIDKSIDYFLDEILGIGETHAKRNEQGPFVVQANFTYLNEMVYKQKFFVENETQILLVENIEIQKSNLKLSYLPLVQQKILQKILLQIPCQSKHL